MYNKHLGLISARNSIPIQFIILFGVLPSVHYIRITVEGKTLKKILIRKFTIPGIESDLLDKSL